MIRISVERLRLLFLLFFLTLAIPSLVLSWKAYEQLRWESFHQYQQEAQSLAKQIDQRLAQVIAKEEARADTDYTFLVLAGNPEAGFIQRSDLSKYPVQSELPGIIGYFQVDNSGAFSSPLLPQESNQSALYGITPEEQVQRSELEFRVRTILGQNQLVSSAVAQPALDDELAELKVSGLDAAGVLVESEEEAPAERPQTSTTTSSVVASESAPEPQIEQLAGSIERNLSDMSANSALEKGSSAPTAAAPKKQMEPSSKLDFGSLQSAEVQEKISRDIGKLEQYQSSGYRAREKRKSAVNEAKSNAAKRVSRLEQNYIPQQLASIDDNSEGDGRAIEINLFQSELEPFKFSLLSSGHLVAYRQVWRNNKRIVQGAVLSAETFFHSVVNEIYLESPIRQVASLNIAYGEQILKTYFGSQARYLKRSPSLQGEQLFEATLSEPFNQIALIFNVTQMPAGAGASFIVMVAFSLMVVLVLGTFLLYRLMVKQMKVAQQQQDFVSSVSHELKTPLTSIRMYGEILKQGWMSDEKREEYYDYIYNEAERLSRLISNVLQISKVNRDVLELELKSIEISELISLINSKIDSQIKQSGFNLKLDVPEEVESLKISADVDALIQIVINLVDNALKYSVNAEEKEVVLSVSRDKKNNVRVSVRDYGPGVPKDQVKKIFQLFYRSGDELTRECSGTGIGLALVKELANAMGAEVSVANHQQGAEFSILFPAGK